MVRMVVGDQGADHVHPVGGGDGEEIGHPVGGVDDHGLAGITVADEVGEVDHLRGERVAHREVLP